VNLVVFIERTAGTPGRRVSCVGEVIGLNGDDYILKHVGVSTVDDAPVQ
jgi:hypothetical protein